VSNNSSGRHVRHCPYHGGTYVSTNFMRRFVYPGDVVARRSDGVPPNSVDTDTHQLACARRHGKQVHPADPIVDHIVRSQGEILERRRTEASA
jgi:hypothetical protein